MSLTYEEFIDKMTIIIKQYEIFDVDFKLDCALIDEYLLEIAKNNAERLNETPFTKEQTPYEMYKQSEYYFLRYMFISNIESDPYTCSFIFDYDLVKTLSRNVKKCFVEIFMYINRDDYTINDIPLDKFDLYTSQFSYIETIDEAIEFFIALVTMKLNTTSRQKLIEAMNDETSQNGIDIIREVENKLYESQGETAKQQMIRDDESNKRWNMRRKLDDERSKLLMKNPIACYKKYGMTFDETYKSFEKLNQRCANISFNVMEESSKFYAKLARLRDEKDIHYEENLKVLMDNKNANIKIFKSQIADIEKEWKQTIYYFKKANPSMTGFSMSNTLDESIAKLNALFEEEKEFL